MRKTTTWEKATPLLLLLFSLLTSCSDETPKEVSRVIKEIEIWEKGDKQANLTATIKFTYNEAGELTQVNSDDADGTPLFNINYSYPDENKFLFNYSSKDENLGRISGTLENGRAYACKFANPSTSVTYTYTKDGYMNRSNDEDLEMQYTWEDGNLRSIKATSRIYNTEFSSSSITNNYSIDLNTLPHFLEKSSDYRRVMNTYCWLADILGKRSNAIAEDNTYFYQYRFDDKGRINELELSYKISSIESSFVFQFIFEE